MKNKRMAIGLMIGVIMAILETAESTGISYYYEILDRDGNQVLEIGFAQRPGKYQKYLYRQKSANIESGGYL